MSINSRMKIMIVLSVTLPLLVTGIWGLFTTKRLSTSALEHSRASLTESGEKVIFQTAKSTAQQIELYLSLHPEIDLNNSTQLQSDVALGKIAVQPVGREGYTAVFDADAITHFHIDPSIVGMDMSTLSTAKPKFWAIFAAALDGSLSDGYYEWEDADGQVRDKYMSIVPVGDTRLRVAATTYIDEFFQPIVETRSQLTAIERDARTQLIVALVSVALAAIVSAAVLGQKFSEPIRQIIEAAARVAAGELRPLALPERDDEIGALAHAFNTMTAYVSDLVSRLETRTVEMDQYITQMEDSNRQNQRRAAQLEASAQVSRAAASELDPDQLLQRAVHLISQQFGHYHAAILLLDETNRWVVLHAANSEGGQRMLARGYQLPIDAQGTIGHVISTGQPRTMFKAGADAVYFDNPDLPGTLSQITLPLVARGQIIGVLDVQSALENAFDAEDEAVLSILADQIAVALDNARLYKASRSALTQVQALQRQQTREDWGKYSPRHESNFYEYRQSGTAAAVQEQTPETDQVLQEGVVVATADDNGQAAALVAPIKVRGQVIGALGLQGANTPGAGRNWSADEITLVEAIADQVAQAMEAARLFDETQRLAQQEQLVIEISDKIRSAPDIDGILRTTVREIRRALGVSHGVIRLGTETHLRPPEEKNELQETTSVSAAHPARFPSPEPQERDESGENDAGNETDDKELGDN
jgi:GAF domain-containing protein/HAMP domain-containing protein